MNARKIKAAVADISADTDPTRKAAKLAAVALGAALELDWSEVRRLAALPGQTQRLREP